MVQVIHTLRTISFKHKTELGVSMLTPVDIAATQYIENICCPFKMCKHALVLYGQILWGKQLKQC